MGPHLAMEEHTHLVFVTYTSCLNIKVDLQCLREQREREQRDSHIILVVCGVDIFHYQAVGWCWGGAALTGVPPLPETLASASRQASA